jgi:hypothetical protein
VGAAVGTVHGRRKEVRSKELIGTPSTLNTNS